MKVKLLLDITGTRSVDGVAKAWPPAGDEIELSEAEALPLLSNGSARAVNTKDADVEARTVTGGGAFGEDEGTRRVVERVTVTRERQSRAKRAHEPINLGVAADEQPAEDVNGPRLPEVHGAASAAVEAVKPDNPYVGPDPSAAQKAAAKVAGKTAPKDAQ